MQPRMQILVAVAILVSLDYSSALTFTQPDDPVNSTLAQDIDTSRSLKKLSRSKRYMSFPEGSSFSVKFSTKTPADATFLPSNAQYLHNSDCIASIDRLHFVRPLALSAIQMLDTWPGLWIGAWHTICQTTHGFWIKNTRNRTRRRLCSDGNAGIYIGA